MSDDYENIEFLAYEEPDDEIDQGTSSSSSSKVLISAANFSNRKFLNSCLTDLRRTKFCLQICRATPKDFGILVALAAYLVISWDDGVSVLWETPKWTRQRELQRLFVLQKKLEKKQ